MKVWDLFMKRSVEIKEKVYFADTVSVYFHCSGFRKLRGFEASESRKL